MNHAHSGRILVRRFIPIVTILVVGVLIGTPVKSAETQQDPSDCGAKSLVLLLSLLGHKISIQDVLATLPPNRAQGVSLSDLQASARALGLRLRGVNLDARNIPLTKPAIAFVKLQDSGHFVVLRPVGVTGKIVHDIDPPSAPFIMDYDRLLGGAAWTGRVLIPETAVDRVLSWTRFGLAIVAATSVLALGIRRVWSIKGRRSLVA